MTHRRPKKTVVILAARWENPWLLVIEPRTTTRARVRGVNYGVTVRADSGYDAPQAGKTVVINAGEFPRLNIGA